MAGTLTYTLRRIVFGDTFTGGELINPNNKRIAYTIEDTDRGLNVGTSSSVVSQTKSQHPKMTAINAGVWTINFRKNTSISSINYIDGGMGRGVVPVLDGNGWGGIRFHGGGSSRASAGCIILGTQLPNTDHIPSSRAVIESVNKEMIHYHLQGYNLQINIVRAKGAKLSSAADALGSFVGENVTGGAGSEFGGAAGTPHEWPDFNLKDFPVMNDEKGRYTNEPILLGIANHLQINGSGGISDVVGGDFGSGISGSSPFASADEFFNKVNWSAAEKYAAGVYHNYKNMVGNRRIRSVPSDFLSNAKAYSSRTGLPVGALVMIGKSEGGFRNCPKNSLGYGGYFGSKYGPEGSFDEQADSVLRSFNTAKKFSPGADNLALLVIMYISHGLPVIGSRWWNAMGGKIWCADPDLIMTKMKECYVAGMKKEASAVRYAEHLANQLASQYMALQIKDMSF